MATSHYDLVIMGSGSTAFAASIAANELGKSAVMTESRTVGGTCVNRGCLPSKNLIEAAKLLHDARAPRYPSLVFRTSRSVSRSQRDGSTRAIIAPPQRASRRR